MNEESNNQIPSELDIPPPIPAPSHSAALPPQSPIVVTTLPNSSSKKKSPNQESPGKRLQTTPSMESEGSQTSGGSGSKHAPLRRTFSSARTEALYLDAKMRGMKLQEKSKAQQEEFTFEPVLITSSHSKIEVTTPFEDRQKEVIARRQEKVKQLSDQEAAQITLTPDLSKTMSINTKVRKVVDGQGKPCYETLHLKHSTNKKRLEEKEKQLYEEYTFKPHLHTTNSPCSAVVKERLQKSVFTRLYDGEQLRNKSSSSAEMKEKREIEGCTFSPEMITKTYSRPTCQNDDDPTGSEEPFHDRLYNVAAKRKIKMDMKKEELEIKSKQDCTFTPEINDKIPNRSASEEGVSAHERLYQKAGRKKEELRASFHDSAYTFKPKLNAPKNTHVDEEVNRLEELYKLGVQKQNKRGPLVEAVKGDAAIMPSDAVIIGVAKDNNALARVRLESEELKECTFQPKLVTKHKRRPSNASCAPACSTILPPLTAERVDMEESFARASEQEIALPLEMEGESA